MKNALILMTILLVAVSCVTQTQVKEIVATSNAAMIDVPALPQADGDAVDEARLNTAVERIETIIAAHPEQTVLINTLRVRQAMMLTVANKPEAAGIVWSKVTKPATQRDEALYSLREKLVWWFGAAKAFKDEDIEKGKQSIASIDAVNKTLPKGSNTRAYLQTMRAAIALAVANKTNTMLGDPEARRVKKRAVADQMVADLKHYTAQYDAQDRRWIEANWTATESFPDVPVSVVRARAELRRLTMAYFKRAQLKKLEEFEPVTWQPGWVNERWQVWKAAN